MLTDTDIIKLTVALSKIFATKDDLKPFAIKDDLKSFATKDDLKPFATKDDLVEMEKRINKKFKSSKQAILDLDQKVVSNKQAISSLDKKVDLLAKEVLDYTKCYFNAHQEALDKHDLRIQKLEHFHA